MRTLATLLLTVAFAAAGAHAQEAATYSLRGVLRVYDPATAEATVSHEAVPGYMPAMTMSFAVGTPAELSALAPGDTLTCCLRVTKDRAWLENVRKDTAATPAIAAARSTPSASAELEPGDELPDLTLVDETGAAVRLSDYRGRALALTFIYLRCPLPTYCPLMNRNFQAAQALLDRLGLKDRVHFLSVSIDPSHDTPAQLAAFAEAHGANPQDWTFATSREAALRSLAAAVGLEFQSRADGISHNLRAVVIDPQGKIRRVFRGNGWTPQELVAEMRAAALAR